MDLLQTVRKEGSRGGRDEFKWTDVKESLHRENYLGHSLMAPVGRWQQGRDLNWYAKTDGIKANDDDRSEAEIARDARKEEMRKIREAEEDARRKALGLPALDRGADGEMGNPNMVALPAAAEKKRLGPTTRPVDAEGESEEKRRRRRSRDDDRRYKRRHRDQSRDGERREDERKERKHRRSPSRSRSRSRERRRDHGRRRNRSRDERPRIVGRERSRDREVDSRRGGDRSGPRARPRSKERDERRGEKGGRRSRSPYARERQAGIRRRSRSVSSER